MEINSTELMEINSPLEINNFQSVAYHLLEIDERQHILQQCIYILQMQLLNFTE